MASLAAKVMSSGENLAARMGVAAVSPSLNQTLHRLADAKAASIVGPAYGPQRQVNSALLARARNNAPAWARQRVTSGPMQGPIESGPMHGPAFYGTSGASQNMNPAYPPIATPSPSIAPRGVPVRSMGANAGLGSIALGAAMGAATGGFYEQGGISGAFKGALGGAAFGAAAGFGGPMAFKHAADMAISAKGVSKYSGAVVSLGHTLNTSGGRRALFASGGMLGGAVFGGDRNTRRGFNKNRGSHIGR